MVDRLADVWEEDIAPGVATAETRWLAARETLRLAERALDEWVTGVEMQLALGAETFTRGVLARQAAVEDARRELWDLDDPGVDGIPVVYLDGKPILYELWGDDPARDRRHVRSVVAEVTLAKADPARRRWQPIAERLVVRWRG